MSEDWKKLDETRIYKDFGDFYVVKPKDFPEPIPFECSVCETLMKDATDVDYFKEYSCCSFCGVFFAEGNKEKWKQGWRPTKEEIEKKRIIR